MKLEDESISKNVAEMSSTILQLQTDAGQKDLEIISLRRQLLKQETENISKLNSRMTVCVGDGNVHDDDFNTCALNTELHTMTFVLYSDLMK